MKIETENPVSAAMYEAASRRGSPRHYLGMSQIGDSCARKLWYGFRGFSPRAADGRLQMIFSLGDRVEEEVLRWLRDAGYRVEGQQDEFSAFGGLFRGHCDGYIDGVTKLRHVLEIKSASDARFKAFKTSGIPQVSPTYYAQVLCYMAYSGLERAVWVVMNKNTCELYIERCEFDGEQFAKIEARAKRIISANSKPARAHARESLECQRCDFGGHCWSPPNVQTARTCGTCLYCRFEGVEPSCSVMNHRIEKWGMACPYWEFVDALQEGADF